MRMGIRCGPLIALAAAALLSACAFSQAETPRQRAYALGVEYAAVQEVAIDYVVNAKPSPEIAIGIREANKVAAGLVKATIRQASRAAAAETVAKSGEAAPTDSGAVASVDAETVAAGQAQGFERLFSMAKGAIARLAAMVGGA